MRPRFVSSLAAVILAACFAGPAAACPFCNVQGQTLSGEVAQADLIVLGTLKNPQRDVLDPTRGTTELHIITVVKDHPYLGGKKILTLPRYVPADPAAADARYMVFCGVYPGNKESLVGAVTGPAILANFGHYQLDPYRGEPAKADSKLADYLKGSLEVKDKPTAARLKYFFQYLDSPELVISSDAFMEFGNADYADVKGLAATLAADKVLGWLTDPQTPASRFGFYGMLIGHCGKPADAAVVRKLLDDPAKAYSSGLDGLITGYILLDPKAGWQYLSDVLSDEKKEFPVRYAGLKVLRFFWEFRPDVLGKPQILDGMKSLMAQADLADLPIEDLRKWEQWNLTDTVVEFAKKNSHAEIPIIRRAVLRFALTAPAGTKSAAEYVEAVRKTDPERVKLVEEMLKDEKPAPAVVPVKK